MSTERFVECAGLPQGACASEDKVSPNEGQLPGEVISQPGAAAQLRKSSNMTPIASETIFGDVPKLTICPRCDKQIVTKTTVSKHRTLW